MKVLRINNNQGEYSINGESFFPIKDITTEQIKTIIETVLFNDSIEYDEEIESNNINNPVEKIIYANLLSKIKQLNNNRENLISNVLNNYTELYNKYQLEEFENQD